MLKRIDKLFQCAMESRLRSQTDRTVREDKRGTDAQIKFAIESIEGLNLSKIASTGSDKDIIGDFFERIMRTGFKQTKGQFFTHSNIINFMVDVIGIGQIALRNLHEGQNPPTMIDPAAGSGSFVVQAMQKVLDTIKEFKQSGGPISDDTKRVVDLVANATPYNIWAAHYCVGLEINPDLGLAAQVNMLLHGDGSSAMLAGPSYGDGLAPFANYPNVATLLRPNSNGLSNYRFQMSESFDFVLTNPPFSSDIAKGDLERYRNSLQIMDDTGTNKSEDLFVDRWFQLLKPKGRLGAVVPNSVLDGRRSAARLWLLRYFWIKAIVSLPASAFQPFTSTKTSIVFAERRTDDELVDSIHMDEHELLNQQGDIYMSKAAFLGFIRSNKKERSIEKNDLTCIRECLEEEQLWK